MTDRGTGTPPEPRRVVFVIRSLNIGGAERQLAELAGGLLASGWKVDVVTFYPGGELRQDLERSGIPVHDLRKTGRWDVVPFTFRLVRTLRALDSPIVHSYLGEANLMVAAARSFLRGARVVWGIRSSNLDAARGDWLGSLITLVNRLLVRRADLVICNSQAGLRLCASMGYPERRMVVVPNGIDVDRFAPSTTSRELIRSEWSVAADVSLIGLVGRLDPIKGHSSLLRAVASLPDRTHIQIVFVGTGPAEYRDDVSALASRLGLGGQVRWAGPRTDMPAVYNALDLCVSASLGEGFPNAVAEAMSSGVACVVTDVGDSASIVGETGWVCPAGDPDALAAAIEAATSSDELRHRGELARRRIVEEYSSARLAAVTADLLSDVVRAA